MFKLIVSMLAVYTGVAIYRVAGDHFGHGPVAACLLFFAVLCFAVYLIIKARGEDDQT